MARLLFCPNSPHVWEQKPNHIACHPLSHGAKTQPAFPAHFWSFTSIHSHSNHKKQIYHVYFQPVIAVCFFKNTTQKFPCPKCFSCLCQLSKLLLNHQVKDISTLTTFPTVPRAFLKRNKDQFSLDETISFFLGFQHEKLFYLASNMNISKRYLTTQWNTFKKMQSVYLQSEH